jgi:hypothetical protein
MGKHAAMSEGQVSAAQNWVENRVSNRECPFCGCPEWGPLAEMRSVIVAETSSERLKPQESCDDGVSIRDVVTLDAVGFACRKCGFVRFHMHPDIDSSPDRT